jgi:transposase-like protein
MAKKAKKQKQSPRARKQYPAEFKLRAIKLYTEEGYTAEMVSRELGIGRSTLTTWARRYRKEGQCGLESRPGGKGRAQVDPAAIRGAASFSTGC